MLKFGDIVRIKTTDFYDNVPCWVSNRILVDPVLLRYKYEVSIGDSCIGVHPYEDLELVEDEDYQGA